MSQQEKEHNDAHLFNMEHYGAKWCYVNWEVFLFKTRRTYLKLYIIFPNLFLESICIFLVEHTNTLTVVSLGCWTWLLLLLPFGTFQILYNLPLLVCKQTTLYMQKSRSSRFKSSPRARGGLMLQQRGDNIFAAVKPPPCREVEGVGKGMLFSPWALSWQVSPRTAEAN